MVLLDHNASHESKFARNYYTKPLMTMKVITNCRGFPTDYVEIIGWEPGQCRKGQ